MSDALAKLDNATRMLAEARTLDEIKKVADLAVAAKTYARAARLGLEAQNYAAEVKLRAERKAGEILARLEKGQGGRPAKTADKVSGVSEYRQTIDEAQVSEKTAERWQKLAAVDGDRFETYIQDTKDAEKELTETGLLATSKVLRPQEVAPWTVDEAKVRLRRAIDAEAGDQAALETALQEIADEFRQGRARVAALTETDRRYLKARRSAFDDLKNARAGQQLTKALDTLLAGRFVFQGQEFLDALAAIADAASDSAPGRVAA